MIVIMASQWDDGARRFASRSVDREVRLLTSRDLSAAGWRIFMSGADSNTAVVDRELVPEKDITGVLTRIPCIDEEELLHIAPEDRSYVASEMTAFLLFWLSQLKCPVLNRPTPRCLSGPCWRTESWVQLAAQAGIPVSAVHRQANLKGSNSDKENGSLATVTVVGDRAFGETSKTLHRHALHLAEQIGVEILVAHFSHRERSAQFISADTYPDLSDDSIGNLVLEHLQPGPRPCA